MKTRTLLLVLALVLPAVVALAGPKQEAKKHIDRAMKAHAAGKFDVALSELRTAYKLDPQPDLLYALGQVYSKLGRCSDATSEFEKFRTAKKKDPQVAKIVDEAIAACHAADTPFADSSPGEKTNGGDSKHEAKPESKGESKYEAKPESKLETKAESKPEEPPTGSDTEQPADLTAHSPAPVASPPVAPTPAAPPSPATPPTSAVQADETAPAAPVATSSSRAWYRDVLGDALVAGGVVALAGAGLEYSSARSALDDAEKAPDLASYNSRVDDAHGTRTVAVVLGVGGVALVGAGVFRLLTHDRSETHGVALVPTSGGGLITWGGSL